MKKILITGATSYIGISFKKWLGNFPDHYSVDSISLRDDSWKKKDFSKYDVVYHVAGIAHIKETKENANLYYKVNRDLTYEVAHKSKVENVKQFIFLSSMSVYGLENGVIDQNTPLEPKSNYGKSKVQAEELIMGLENSTFRVTIIRPPMIYGKDCKGNYPRLSVLAKKAPIFPYVNNKRSMIYIDNLSEFVRLLIDDFCRGILFPQNKEYVCTTEMVKQIREVNGKKLHLTKLFKPLFSLPMNATFKKVFGDLVYDKKLSLYDKKYDTCSFPESIKNTEVN